MESLDGSGVWVCRIGDGAEGEGGRSGMTGIGSGGWILFTTDLSKECALTALSVDRVGGVAGARSKLGVAGADALGEGLAA